MVLVVGLKNDEIVGFFYLSFPVFPLLQGNSNAFKWMKEMKETEDGMNEKMGFLDGFMVAFRDEIHTDILVKPCDGPPIPTHKALLVSNEHTLSTTKKPSMLFTYFLFLFF